MKKTYVKPMMGFESFELSTNIAQGCVKHSNATPLFCAVDIGGESIFVDDIASGCTYTNPNIKVCYDVPTAGMNVFTS